MPQITTADVARKGRMSVRTVLRLVREGELPVASKFPTKTGGYLFEESVVDQVIAARSEKVDSS